MKTKIEEIANTFLKIETLDTRNRDRLDFYNIPVWQIKLALEAAYKAGQEQAFENFKEPILKLKEIFK